MFRLFKRKPKGEEVLLKKLSEGRGLLWDRINELKEQLQNVEGAVKHHTKEMEEMFPTTHHLENGLYTRQVLMPKGSFVVSFIHKQSHPSFFLSGEMDVLNDKGEIKRIKAPMTVQTEIGTQRVAYMREDCVWACVYKTDAKNIEAAERDVYTENYLELPQSVINEKILVLCQE